MAEAGKHTLDNSDTQLLTWIQERLGNKKQLTYLTGAEHEILQKIGEHLYEKGHAAMKKIDDETTPTQKLLLAIDDLLPFLPTSEDVINRMPTGGPSDFQRAALKLRDLYDRMVHEKPKGD